MGVDMFKTNFKKAWDQSFLDKIQKEQGASLSLFRDLRVMGESISGTALNDKQTYQLMPSPTNISILDYNGDIVGSVIEISTDMAARLRSEMKIVPCQVIGINQWGVAEIMCVG